MDDTNKFDNIAAILRTMVETEGAQVDRRLTWLCQLQGFLFASLGFAWDKEPRLTTVLACLGISVAILVFISLIAATVAMRRIRDYWHRTKPDDYTGPDIFGFYPDRIPFAAFLAAENLIPVVLMLGWIVVLFFRFL